MNLVKVKALKRFSVPNMHLFLEGMTYVVPNEIALVLAQRDLVVLVVEKKESKKVKEVK